MSNPFEQMNEELEEQKRAAEAARRELAEKLAKVTGGEDEG